MFKFGSGAATAPAASTPSFSFSAAPSTAFGVASGTTSFGAPPTSGSLFGTSNAAVATSTAGATGSLFGAPASGGIFGAAAPAAPVASSASLFGAPTPPSLFGASPSGAFGATSSPDLFGAKGLAAPGSQAFGTFGSTLGGGGGGLFGAPLSSSSLFAPSVPQQQISSVLTTKEGKLLMHITKWEEISDSGQAALLELEKVIAQQREDCRMLDNNQRLWGEEGRQLKKDVAEDEVTLQQALGGLQAALQGDLKTLSVFREKALALLHDTEVAVRTFQRSHRWRTAGKVLPGQALPPGIREQLNGPVTLPSAFLRRAVSSFQDTLEQYRKMVAEVEALLPPEGSSQYQQAPLPVDVLPTVLRNLHDFFCHVAARLEKLHDSVAVHREAFLQRRQKSGNNRDPFKEAERLEHLRKEAQKKKTTVIPPRHPQQQPPQQQQQQLTGAQPLLQIQAPPTPAGGLFGSTPAAAPGASLFGGTTPAATAVTPTPSLFGGATTPAPNAVGGFGFGAGGTTTSLFSNVQSTPASGTTTSGTRRGRSRK